MIPKHRADDAAIGRWTLLLVSAVAIALGGYYWYRNKAVEPVEPAPTVMDLAVSLLRPRRPSMVDVLAVLAVRVPMRSRRWVSMLKPACSAGLPLRMELISR